MDPSLREHFDRAVGGEPGMDVAGLARAAIAEGGRVRRRRRRMAMTGVAAGVLVVALAAAGLGLRSAATSPATQALATQAADLSMRAMMIEAASACGVPAGDEAPEGSIFLNADVTDDQRAAVAAALKADARVAEMTYESQQQAYEKFVALWKDSPDFVKSISPEDLPESFRVHLTDDSYGADFTTKYQKISGVDDVVGLWCQNTPAPGGTK